MAAFLDSVYQTGWRKRQAQAKFWSHIRPRRKDECWHWVGHVTEDGYGVFSRWKGHVIMWEMHNGRPVPDGMQVCHSCDVPGCVNPHHLFVGSHQVNVDDKVAKSRQYRTVTDEKVLTIRALRESGATYRAIGAAVGLSHGHVRFVLKEAKYNAHLQR